MASVVANLFNFLGLMASPHQAQIIPGSSIPTNDVTNFDKSGVVSDPNIWSGYNDVMRRPSTFIEALSLWNEMASWDLIAAMLNTIVDETLQTDSSSTNSLWYECNDSNVEDDLNDTLSNLGAETLLPSQVWHIAGMGNNFEKIDYCIGEGINGLTYVNPVDIKRYWLERSKKCIGFRWDKYKPDDKLTKIGDMSFNRNQLQFNSQLAEDLWYPWDFLHMRRLYRFRQSENGEPLFEEASGIYKKLRIAIDQMTVHRAQVQPDRYVFEIDVKDQSPSDQYKSIQRWKNSLRNSLSFKPQTNDPFGKTTEFHSFYNTLALDSIFWVAKPRDFNHTITKLAGTANVPDVHDIELMTNLFFSITGMPKNWFGLGATAEGTGAPVSGKALLAQDMRFLRKIKNIRKPIIESYTWLAYFHTILKHDKDIASLDIQTKMTPIGSLDDQLKVEVLGAQTDILDKLADVMDKYGLPKEAWIELVFKKYMNLPDEIVHTFITALPNEVETMESMKNKRPVKMKEVMEDIIKKVGPDKIPTNNLIQTILDGKLPKRSSKKYKSVNEVLNYPKLQDNDIIVSGYGQVDPLNDFNKPVKLDETTVTERLVKKTTENKLNESQRAMLDAHQHRNK